MADIIENIQREYPHHNVRFRDGSVYLNGKWVCDGNKSEQDIKSKIDDKIDGSI